MRAVLLVVALCCAAAAAVGTHNGHDLPPKKYNTAGGPRDDMLNVHLVCHTHNDVGWLKTLDEYFYGANNSIQHAGVQYILDSVTLALEADPNRKFIYVEIAFFSRWWNEQEPAVQELFTSFVENGQIEFINGGWCMSDEAATHYNDIIDQMTLGHMWLLETFGVKPTVGWHIDPFGHSATQPILFEQMAFDSFYFGRIDYQDKEKRIADKSLEMIWRSSQSQGASVELFTGVTYNGYNPPDNFCFDLLCADPPVQDDPRLEDYNVQGRVDGFVGWCQRQADAYATNNIMLTMGSDFQYENANEWYKNLDKLIHYVNQDGRVNVFYSTPSIYTAAVNAANYSFPVKTDDFFPYADHPYAYWSGYFTSRVALKPYIRTNQAVLQACKQIEVLTSATQPWPPVDGLSSELLRSSQAIAQHHDAVTGTSKQHVAYDYALRLAAGAAECNELMNQEIASIMTQGVPPEFNVCLMLNLSVCNVSSSGGSFSIVAYNQLARATTQWVRVPVMSTGYSVVDATNQPVPSQVYDIDPTTLAIRGIQSDAPYTLVFPMTVPAVGFTTYFAVLSSEATAEVVEAVTPPQGDEVTVTNGIITLRFDSSTGQMTYYENIEDGVATAINQTFAWYNGSAGNNINSSQASGAYIFRPNGTMPFFVSPTNTATLQIINGSQLIEVRQVFSNIWCTNIFRLYTGANYVDAEFTVGPIPIDDELGKEVISFYATDLATNSTWYTDSNGREMQTRIRNYRPTWTLNVTEPVAGNYYPVNSAIKIQDAFDGAAFTILVDRSEGGSSMYDGTVEVMVHRRLLYDDGRGVGEPLNETGVPNPVGVGLITRGTHRIGLTNKTTAGQWHRFNEEIHTWPLQLSFGVLSGAASDFISSHTCTWSGVASTLPENVHLLTLEMWSSMIVIRFAHMYAVGEDPILSQPVSFDLSTFLADYSILTVEELTLSANQPLNEVNRMRWSSQDGVSDEHETVKPTMSRPTSTIVTLDPQQIRTFGITVSPYATGSSEAIKVNVN